jgi:hypothetical protein
MQFTKIFNSYVYIFYSVDATMRMFVECIPKKTCFALIVDACHSAGMIEGATEKVGRSEVKIKRLKEPETLPFGNQTGRKLGTLFCACQSDQVTTYSTSGSHFTNAIIEVLDKTRGKVTNEALIKEVNKVYLRDGRKMEAGLWCDSKTKDKRFLKV